MFGFRAFLPYIIAVFVRVQDAKSQRAHPCDDAAITVVGVIEDQLFLCFVRNTTEQIQTLDLNPDFHTLHPGSTEPQSITNTFTYAYTYVHAAYAYVYAFVYVSKLCAVLFERIERALTDVQGLLD